ncbi:hypothetical protein [Microbacterium sp. BH-3-3-3]|uniref:hypothetical protein n=1 Tax=Microbacterium sp. BH-3-3-3 TaxID=1906742 RepID=UPI000892A3A0|nr:hypothetical protein [Microbacterium sp. BH-3-3-3]AOX45882.1 hypothetical protein BJP65_08715 [Microbacterium sp. BH-3-3-3]
MTYVSILPKTIDAQIRLTEQLDTVMNLLFTAAREVLDIPDNDIIVELHSCTTLAFNASAVRADVAPDVVLTFVTSDAPLERLFSELCERVVGDWNGPFETLKLEVWASLLGASDTNIEV